MLGWLWHNAVGAMLLVCMTHEGGVLLTWTRYGAFLDGVDGGPA